MRKEQKTKIVKKLLEISNLIHTLKMALNNMDQPNADTLPYGCLASLIENKINCIINDFC